jgi:hypothetical protein
MSVDRDRLMKYMNSHRPAGVLLKTTKERIALDTEYGIRKLDKELAEVRACYPGQHIVLIIDPIMAFMDGSVSDEYNVKKMLYGNLDEMKKKHGLSVIIIHHAHKNKYDATGRAITEGGNAGMGSMLFWAWCDTYIEMKLLNPFGEMDKVRFSFFKVRNATSLPPADFSVKWDRTTLKPSVYDRKERVDNQDGEQTEPTVRGLVGKDRNNGQGGG